MMLLSESYIHTPNYPNDYPHNYNQVMAIAHWLLLMFDVWDWIDCCRLGSCSQPMDKQSPSPLTVWKLTPYISTQYSPLVRLLPTVIKTGLRSMMALPPSATAALVTYFLVNITMVMVTTLAPPSPAPSPALAPFQSGSALIPAQLQAGSLGSFAALHTLLQIWLRVSGLLVLSKHLHY